MKDGEWTGMKRVRRVGERDGGSEEGEWIWGRGSGARRDEGGMKKLEGEKVGKSGRGMMGVKKVEVQGRGE